MVCNKKKTYIKFNCLEAAQIKNKANHSEEKRVDLYINPNLGQGGRGAGNFTFPSWFFFDNSKTVKPVIPGMLQHSAIFY